MSLPTVIRAENLGKRYILSHVKGESYHMARDAVSRLARDAGRRLLHPLRSSANRPMPGLSTSEEFWALKGIDFAIGQGEVVGIVGRNGAGKSTLLKILSRITEPTTGHVALKGKVNSLLEVGTGFHGELTGRENIFLNGSILGMSRQQIIRKFDEIVDFSEVGTFLDTPMKRYSSGMQVRLAFSIAAHLDSEVLIIDEVLAVGDVGFQQKCLAKMREFATGGGRTILFVSHAMGTVRDLCSRCLLLRQGEIVAEGTPEQVVHEYLGEVMLEQAVCRDYQVPQSDSPFIRRLRLLPAEPAEFPGWHSMALEIQLEHLHRCSDPVVEWHLENADGMVLFRVRKELSREKEFLLEKGGAVGVTCRIPQLPLCSGQYWLGCNLLPGLNERSRPLNRVLGVALGRPEEIAAMMDTGAGRDLVRVVPVWEGPFLAG